MQRKVDQISVYLVYPSRSSVPVIRNIDWNIVEFCSEQKRRTVPNHWLKAPVHLDVGGKNYTTSLATLKSVPGSRIYNTFTGRTAVTLDKKTNCYFIDRDGELFRYVLQYLRDGSLSTPDDFNEWEQLEKEAIYESCSILFSSKNLTS